MPYIVTTTGMIGDLVKNIVKDKAKVESLMGPGVDPHLYKATQSDLTKLNRADIVFYNGLLLEGKMQDILEKLGKSKTVVGLGSAIDKDKLISTSYGKEGSLTFDPHIWFDVMLWAETAKVINKIMQQFDKPNMSYYQANTETYLDELYELHKWVKQEINSIPGDQRIVITSHDAFEYFGKAYDIEVEGLQGISTASDYGLQDITRMVNKIVERKIKAVFIETSVSGRSLQAVVEGSREKGHEVIIGGSLFSDAMGKEGTPDGTYIGMVRSNVTTIVSALK